MNERMLRFDSLVAICALLISCVAAGASVYQTRVFRDQYAATIWPYISIEDTANTSGTGAASKLSKLDITLTNDGLGPALIRSAQLSIDGRQVPAWNNLRDLIARSEFAVSKKLPAHDQMASINASTTLRPGDSRPVFSVTLKHGIPMPQFLAHDVTLGLCYCSLNGQCWTLHSQIGSSSKSVPQPAAACNLDQHVDSRSV